MEGPKHVSLFSEAEENVPPPKKLKQAKLSFFKTITPESKPSTKVNVSSAGKKRKTSGGSDSPNKVPKKNKTILTTSHTESPNSPTKQHKTKVIHTKLDDSDDHEVSSSSEADSNGKSSGKCCLLERFVVKMPHSAHQEISSTVNESDKIEQSETAQSEADDLNKTDDVILIEDEEAFEERETECESTSQSVLPKKSDLKVGGKNINNSRGNCSKSNKQKSPKNTGENNKFAKKTSPKNTGEKKKSPKCTKKEKEQSPKDVQTVPEAIQCNETKAVTSNSEGEEECVASKSHQQKSEDKDQMDSKQKLVVMLTKIETIEESKEKETKEDDGKDEETSTPGKSNCSMDQGGSPIVRTAGETPKSGSKKGRKVVSAKKAELMQKQKEEKEKERLEKKRKLEEERAEKERQKLEKKEARDKEKQEQKDKLEKEKQEKLKAKEEERKKKEEEKRVKDEEKKKILEAKEEEKKKKEEEKQKKEEEKRLKEEEKQREEEEKRMKDEKRKQAFQKFFIKPKDDEVKAPVVKSVQSGFFIPFELKKDMHLAPSVRREVLSGETKDNLDRILGETEISSSDYIKQLSEDYRPHRTGRVLRKNPQPSEDVEIVHDKEALKKVFHKVKLLQFHTDYRPPYYGTWRKTAKVSPRNPSGKDESVFDYEVDSDDEWEEEEPGESLSCSEGEEEKAEDGDEEEDDGWMVPHGYLSEDEGCNDDDEITPEKLKMQQQAKAKAWEEECKRKLQAAPLMSVGCFFENEPSASMSGDVRLLYEFKAEVLYSVTPIPTALSGGLVEEPTEETVPPTPQVAGPKKMSVPEEAIPDLIRLVHGNMHGIKRLVREFRVFWLQKHPPEIEITDNQSKLDNPNESVSEKDSVAEKDSDVSILNESAADMSLNVNEDEDMIVSQVEDAVKTVKEDGSGCSMSKRQLELKILSIAVREKRPGNKKICWYVHQDILSQHEFSDLSIPNTWVYLTSGPKRKSVTPTPVAGGNEGSNEPKDGDVDKDKTPAKPLAPKDQKSIMEFALSKEELEKQNKVLPPTPSASTAKPDVVPITPKGNNNKVTPKSKGRKSTPGQKGKALTPVAKESKNSLLNLFMKKTPAKSEVSMSEKKEKDEETDSDIEMIDDVDYNKDAHKISSYAPDCQNEKLIASVAETELKKSQIKEAVSSPLLNMYRKSENKSEVVNLEQKESDEKLAKNNYEGSKGIEMKKLVRERSIVEKLKKDNSQKDTEEGANDLSVQETSMETDGNLTSESDVIVIE